MKKRMKKLVSLLLGLAMVVSMVACGNDKGQTALDNQQASKDNQTVNDADSTDGDGQEIVEITYYCPDVTANGSQDMPALEQYLIDTLGVVLRARPAGDGVLQSMIASGELTDIVKFHSADERKAAIEAGVLLDLAQYKDQLPNLFENELFAPYIAKEMDTYGGVYGVATEVGPMSGLNGTPDIRWDLYKAVGYPEVESSDELLEVLKQMQDTANENNDGQKVYGLGLFYDWDGAYPYMLGSLYFNTSGYNLVNTFSEVKWDLSEEPSYIFGDDSNFYNGLKWLFKANQMGILDPDGPTMPYDEYNARALAGLYCYTPWTWFRDFNNQEGNAEAGVGYQSFLADYFTLRQESDAIFGSEWYFAVNANSENLDATLKFFNYMCGYDWAEQIMNGEEGVLYEYNEEGTRVMTEEFAAHRYEGAELVWPENVLNSWQYYSILSDMMFIMTRETINPSTGVQLHIEKQYPVVSFETPLAKDWASVYGELNLATYNGELGADVIKGHIGLYKFPALNDDLNSLIGSFASVMNPACYEMIFAADEAEFDAKWEQLKADAEDMGIKAVHDQTVEDYSVAKNVVDKYVK